jgi:hypothetical protein
MITIKKYKNAVIAKIPNRKIHIMAKKNDGFNIHFTKLTDDLTPHAMHTVLKNKIVVTSIGLTEEAFQALYLAMGEYMRDTKFKPFHKDSL